MEGSALLHLPEGMLIEQIHITENGLVIEVVATHPQSCCPLCSQPSSSIHSHYRRILRDAPCAGRRVQLFLTARRFYCCNALCERKVFTERLPTFVEPWARMTIRYCQQLTSIGLATCGKGGVRLAARLGIQTSRQTILRRIMALPDVARGSVVFVGIDDFSFRRGFRFGTILVNLESHRVVDLLPDRQAETAAQWMWHHPDIAVVSRDRGGEYAKAASQGAPQAIQVADRFHIVKNLTEATQLLLARWEARNRGDKRHGRARAERAAEAGHLCGTMASSRTHSGEESTLDSTSRALSTLSASGPVTRSLRMKPKQIAQRLDLGERTVRDWLKGGTFPEAKKRRKRQSSFDAF